MVKEIFTASTLFRDAVLSSIVNVILLMVSRQRCSWHHQAFRTRFLKVCLWQAVRCGYELPVAWFVWGRWWRSAWLGWWAQVSEHRSKSISPDNREQTEMRWILYWSADISKSVAASENLLTLQLSVSIKPLSYFQFTLLLWRGKSDQDCDMAGTHLECLCANLPATAIIQVCPLRRD